MNALEGNEIRVQAKIAGNEDASPIERTFAVTSRKDKYDVYDFDIGAALQH